MEVVYRCCCGIDVHKKMVVACIIKNGKRNVREFETHTAALRELCDWFLKEGCEQIAMESTGVFWRPLYNLFEMKGLAAMVVNAQHMKALPGRKTDIKDAEWIADLLRHGLLKSSYIPDKSQRELRDVVRYRKSLIEERAREYNRFAKMLQSANIKLDSVVSSLFGSSARKLLGLIIKDADINVKTIEPLVTKGLHADLEILVKALEGIVSPVQRKLLAAILDHIDDMTRRIGDLDVFVERQMLEAAKAIEALCEIPGIGPQTAQVILAEIGMDMKRFPSAAHLCSWAGVCPGNRESAGKRGSGRTNRGNKTLKTTLATCAKSASRSKTTFFAAQYQRIAARRGGNRATLAVAHSMLIAVWHVLSGAPYRELGAEHYNNFNRERKINGYLKKLRDLGWSLDISLETSA